MTPRSIIDRWAVWPVIAPLLLGVVGMMVFFAVSSAPGSPNAVLVASHPPTTLLDTLWHYDAGQAQAALEAYGVEGRAAYRQFQPVDDLFLSLYGLGLFLLLYRLLRGRWRRLSGLPLLIAAADLSENLLLAPLLVEGSAFSPGLATTAGWVTTLKWGLSGVVLLVLVGTLMRKRFQRS